MRALGLESGTYRAMHQPEAPSFGAFWRLARVRAKQHISGVTLLPDHLPGIRSPGS
jgi:hypothetical protein